MNAIYISERYGTTYMTDVKTGELLFTPTPENGLVTKEDFFPVDFDLIVSEHGEKMKEDLMNIRSMLNK